MPPSTACPLRCVLSCFTNVQVSSQGFHPFLEFALGFTDPQSVNIEIPFQRYNLLILRGNFLLKFILFAFAFLCFSLLFLYFLILFLYFSYIFPVFSCVSRRKENRRPSEKKKRRF
jgi:hypothetical protein